MPKVNSEGLQCQGILVFQQNKACINCCLNVYCHFKVLAWSQGLLKNFSSVFFQRCLDFKVKNKIDYISKKVSKRIISQIYEEYAGLVQLQNTLKLTISPSNEVMNSTLLVAIKLTRKEFFVISSNLLI